MSCSNLPLQENEFTKRSRKQKANDDLIPTPKSNKQKAVTKDTRRVEVDSDAESTEDSDEYGGIVDPSKLDKLKEIFEKDGNRVTQRANNQVKVPSKVSRLKKMFENTQNNATTQSKQATGTNQGMNRIPSTLNANSQVFIPTHLARTTPFNDSEVIIEDEAQNPIEPENPILISERDNEAIVVEDTDINTAELRETTDQIIIEDINENSTMSEEANNQLSTPVKRQTIPSIDPNERPPRNTVRSVDTPPRPVTREEQRRAERYDIVNERRNIDLYDSDRSDDGEQLRPRSRRVKRPPLRLTYDDIGGNPHLEPVKVDSLNCSTKYNNTLFFDGGREMINKLKRQCRRQDILIQSMELQIKQQELKHQLERM